MVKHRHLYNVSNVVFDDKMISNEKFINYKVSKLFKIYNFHFDGFFKRGFVILTVFSNEVICEGNSVWYSLRDTGKKKPSVPVYSIRSLYCICEGKRYNHLLN
jgi:hypothetical protein